MMKQMMSIAALAMFAGAAQAQVVLSEIYENPAGGDDEFWEFIELYGHPGMSLDGYAVALIKGGMDPNGDGVPSEDPEIDEAFSLDGLTIGANGFLVLYHNGDGFNEVGEYLMGPFAPAGSAVAGGSGSDLHIPSSGHRRQAGERRFVDVRDCALASLLRVRPEVRQPVRRQRHVLHGDQLPGPQGCEPGPGLQQPSGL